jgi:hypothetical protein
MQKNRRTASGALRALLTLSATTALLAATSHFAAPHDYAARSILYQCFEQCFATALHVNTKLG